MEINCRECGHGINEHAEGKDMDDVGEFAYGECDHLDNNDGWCPCKLTPQDIAAHAVKRAMGKGWDMALDAMYAKFRDSWNELNEGEMYETHNTEPESS